MLKQDDYIKGRIVEMAWRFGTSYGGGHMAGQLVMHTLSNRVRVGWGSWLQILDNVPKFMAENELPPLVHPNVWSPEFVKLLQTVDGVYEGSAVDLSKGALYWGALNKIERTWFREKILNAEPESKSIGINSGGVEEYSLIPGHQRVVDMNNLSFWK